MKKTISIEKRKKFCASMNCFYFDHGWILNEDGIKCKNNKTDSLSTGCYPLYKKGLKPSDFQILMARRELESCLKNSVNWLDVDLGDLDGLQK